ncbi:MAG: hypothetical protein ACKVZ6_00135 [Kineosporiaceae bacterium]
MPDDRELGWLVLLAEERPGGIPVAHVEDGSPAGYLLVVRRHAKPDRGAVRVEPTVIGAGPPLAVSLVLPARDEPRLFDDPAVVEAMRAVLRDPGRTPLFSTLVDGSTRWAGSISGTDPVTAARHPSWWQDDPFARLGPQHRLLVPAGVLAPRPLPVGPGHQRHAGAPWPWGRFSGAVPPS